MKVFLHADDFGLTRKITDDIIECIDAGVINSVSIMANGYAFDYAVEELIKRKDRKINLVLHVNLDQGKALSDSKLLTDAKGYLDKGFEGIFWRSLLLRGISKDKLEEEVYREVKLQIIKVLPLFKALNLPLKIDGERCTHLIPVVFGTILKLSDKYPINSIRIVRESWLFILSKYPQYFFSAGILKLLMLRIFTSANQYERELVCRNIKFSDYTLSIVKSGEMTQAFIKRSLEYIKEKNSLEIEIVFHPFKPLDEELFLWENRNIYKSHFASDKRGGEKRELLKHRDYFSSLNNKN